MDYDGLGHSESGDKRCISPTIIFSLEKLFILIQKDYRALNMYRNRSYFLDSQNKSKEIIENLEDTMCKWQRVIRWGN